MINIDFQLICVVYINVFLAWYQKSTTTKILNIKVPKVLIDANLHFISTNAAP